MSSVEPGLYFIDKRKIEGGGDMTLATMVMSDGISGGKQQVPLGYSWLRYSWYLMGWSIAKFQKFVDVQWGTTQGMQSTYSGWFADLLAHLTLGPLYRGKKRPENRAKYIGGMFCWNPVHILGGSDGMGLLDTQQVTQGPNYGITRKTRPWLVHRVTYQKRSDGSQTWTGKYLDSVDVPLVSSGPAYIDMSRVSPLAPGWPDSAILPGRVEVNFLNIRVYPSIDANIVGGLPIGYCVGADGVQQWAQGDIWWHIPQGWVAQRYQGRTMITPFPKP